MMPGHPTIGDVRGRGLMIGVEFVRNRRSKQRAPGLRNQIVQEAFHRGLLLLGAGPNTLRFVPPLNVTCEHIEEALMIFETALSAVEAGHAV